MAVAAEERNQIIEIRDPIMVGADVDYKHDMEAVCASGGQPCWIHTKTSGAHVLDHQPLQPPQALTSPSASSSMPFTLGDHLSPSFIGADARCAHYKSEQAADIEKASASDSEFLPLFGQLTPFESVE